MHLIPQGPVYDWRSNMDKVTKTQLAGSHDILKDLVGNCQPGPATQVNLYKGEDQAL